MHCVSTPSHSSLKTFWAVMVTWRKMLFGIVNTCVLPLLLRKSPTVNGRCHFVLPAVLMVPPPSSLTSNCSYLFSKFYFSPNCIGEDRHLQLGHFHCWLLKVTSLFLELCPAIVHKASNGNCILIDFWALIIIIDR